VKPGGNWHSDGVELNSVSDFVNINVKIIFVCRCFCIQHQIIKYRWSSSIASSQWPVWYSLRRQRRLRVLVNTRRLWAVMMSRTHLQVDTVSDTFHDTRLGQYPALQFLIFQWIQTLILVIVIPEIMPNQPWPALLWKILGNLMSVTRKH
jgi:hypothetical protein